MIKILSASQLKEADAYTITHNAITSVQLMEQAAMAFVAQFEYDYPNIKIPKYILCGNGNNGGDGLAIARLLQKKGHNVTVFTFPSKHFSSDYLYQLKNYEKIENCTVFNTNDTTFIQKINKDAIIIDALLGIGQNRPIEKDSLYYQIIEQINQTTFKAVVAVDVPSGLLAKNELEGIAINATDTYTFQFPKLNFLFPQTGNFTGSVKILAIGIHPQFTQDIKTDKYVVEKSDILSILKKRNKFTHKGTFGHVYIFAGSIGKIGAAVLCSKATLRSGAGMVSVHIPSCGYAIMQTAFPEAMCTIDKQKDYISTITNNDKFSTIAIGPGIGTHATTAQAISAFLMQYKRPLVMDADALNILAKHQILLQHLPQNSILTPHPKEFERLAGKWKNDLERLELQQIFSKKHKIILILKGANSSITDTDGSVYFNTTGNAGMATAGSGDVLTGIIAGLLAQNYTPIQAAILGVFLHGLSGDLALRSQSMESLIASDIIENLGNAFNALHQ